MTTQPGSNVSRMIRARESLRGKWGLAVGGAAVYALVVFAVSGVPVLGAIVSLLTTGAMSIGLARFTLAFARHTPTRVSEIFTGFDSFRVGLATHLLQTLFICLWALLLIIPGVMAALSYAMTYFILSDDPSLGARQAITRSKQLMNGHRWELFCLSLRFFGWMLLCVLTLGIGFLWLLPYIMVSMAHFYDDIRATSAPAAAAAEPTAVA